MDILEDELFKIFVQNRELRDSSVYKYQQTLKNYTRFLNKSLSELITEAEQEEDQLIRMRNRKIKTYLLSFKDDMASKEYSPRTISTNLTIVRSFYTEFDIDIPKMRFKKGLHKEVVEDLPNKEEIKKALDVANIKYQSIILLMLSSGMRGSDVRALKYNDFLTSLKDYIKIPHTGMVNIEVVVNLLEEIETLVIPIWRITDIKTQTPYITFSTPESLTYLLKYLEKQQHTSRDQPLFPPYNNRDKHMSDRSFTDYFQYINRECEFGKNDRQIKFRSHSLRKLFATTLSKAGVQQLTIDRLLAHSVPTLTDAYIKPTLEGLKKQYIGCIEELSVYDVKVNTVKDKGYIELENQIQELRDIINADERLKSQIRKG